jgi:phage FluMu protein Com
MHCVISPNETMNELRCPNCKKVLLKYTVLKGYLEQKCPRCGKIMKLKSE